MELNPKICICGGGSLGTVSAGVISSMGLEVSLLTGHPEKWKRHIRVVDQEGKTFEGDLDKISSEPERLIPRADIVLLCLPGYLIENMLREIRPFLKPGTAVGSIVGSTGFFFMAHEILPPSTPLFAFQRVPFIARVGEYGAQANLLGYKPALNVALENFKNPGTFVSLLSRLFLTPVSPLQNFYEASLTNSNPILHTGRLYSLWRNYDGRPVKSPALFYSDWTDEASEILIRMDEEFMRLLRALGIREGVIPSLLDYYESVDASSLTAKLRSIRAFSNIPAPMRETPQGWVPDFDSRYFREDFPYGLRIIRDLAHENGIDTPVIDKVYNWGASKL